MLLALPLLSRNWSRLWLCLLSPMLCLLSRRLCWLSPGLCSLSRRLFWLSHRLCELRPGLGLLRLGRHRPGLGLP